MSSALIVLVYALAVARVTRLITADKLTETPRAWLIDRAWRRWRPEVPVPVRPDADEPKPAYLLSCPWCTSIYVAAVAAPIAYLWGDRPWFFIPALALAFSHTTGLLAKIGE